MTGLGPQYSRNGCREPGLGYISPGVLEQEFQRGREIRRGIRGGRLIRDTFW